MSVQLDHLLWAAPDLDAGTAEMGVLTGIRPSVGGSHPGFGTRNSLLGLGPFYLEVISPDPAQPLAGTRGEAIAALPHAGLMTFAVRSRDLDAGRAAAKALGLATRGPIPMRRTRPDGVELSWTIMHVDHLVFGELIPFMIDWQASPHPSESLPGALELRDFEVLHPRPEPLRRIYAALDIPVEVRRAARPGFLARIAGPAGDVVLLSP